MSSRHFNSGNTRASWALLLAVAAFSLAGCGSEVRGPVSGRVTFEGTPITQGLVCFQNAALGVHMTAPINADGTYEVTMARGKGLPLGTYRVFIAPPLPDLYMGEPQPGLKPPDLSQFPLPYLKPETSGLTLEVQRTPNHLNIDMRRTPANSPTR